MSTKSKISGELPAADDYASVLAEERLIVEAQVAIHQLLRGANLKQSDLAQLLQVSEARVSQMFSENPRNLTLRTLARVFHVLGSRCRIVADPALSATAARPVEQDPAEGLDDAPGAEDFDEDDVTATDLVMDDADAGYKTKQIAADAWLSASREFLDMLSEDAPFASRIVWVTDDAIAPANANHVSAGSHGRRDKADARRWAATPDRYAYV